MLPVRILSTALLKPKGLRSPLHAGAAVALRYKHSNISPSLLQRRTFSSSGSGGGFGHLGHDEDTRYLSPFVTGSYADSIPTDVPKPPVIYALCIDPPFRPLLRGVPIGTTIKDKTLMRVLLERHKKGDPHFIGVFLADRSVVKNDTVEEGKDEPVPDEQLLDVVKEEKSKVETPDSKPATPEYVSAPSSVGSAEKFNEKSQEKTERDAINTSESTISALGVHRIGMYAQVHRLVRSGGGLEVVVSGIHRVKITGVQTGGAPGVQVQVTHHEDGESKEAEEMDDETVAYAHEIRSVIKEIAPLKPEVWKPGVQAYFATSQTNLWILADHASWMTNSDCHQIQEVVETLELKPRLRLALSLLKRELKLKLIQREISQSVDDTIGSNHREYLLKQQLKAIQSKLGASEGKGPRDVISTYKARLEGKIVPPEVRAVIDEECDKLASQQESSSEYHLSLKYLDWLTVMPWGTLSPENFDIAHAESVLNEDHFGMQDVKDRILEFIAAGKLIGRVPNGKIICLLGPPGVGKTSIGRSIARALGRAFHRITVGGMWDSAEIRGHRRTYIGALPGKFVSALKRTQTLNPVIMIDEIDKMGRHRGDPTTALLEVLDPEQNNAFMDSYLDVPMDFSKALFICTANSDDLPGPLADRMEFITLSGYVDDEKLKISQRFLCPRAAAETGLTTSRLTLTDAALLDLIRWYCRESGVRSLQKIIEKVYRKGSLQLVRAGSDAPPVVVDSDNLEKYVGPRK
jgi:endopeptidase La